MTIELAGRCSEYLLSIKSLLELAGENVFKIRAFDKAAQAVLAVDDLELRAKTGTLTEIAGIGKGIAQVLTEYLASGESEQERALKKDLPPGLVELTSVPGLGPKKARVIIETLGISSLSELEYACQENRLITLPGFGEKVQTKILEGLRFLKSALGKKRIDEAFDEAKIFLKVLEAHRESKSSEITGYCEVGALRRRDEIISQLEFLIELKRKPKEDDTEWNKRVDSLRQKLVAEAKKAKLVLNAVPHFAYEGMGYKSLELTATPQVWTMLQSALEAKGITLAEYRLSELSEEALMSEWLTILGAKSLKIPAECLSDPLVLAAAMSGELNQLVAWDALKGGFHLHTRASDGIHTLDEMVETAVQLGWKYIGVSDHSQSAHYAGGLNAAKLKEQRQELERVQSKYPQIKIYWGIESDILQDGSLDYPDSVLEKFDFVIASVHQRFKADKDQMTARLIKAIQNPYTTMIGHLSGRLLLGREPYAFDEDAVFKAAAQAGVIIELNASPHRLDVDWRYGPKLKKYQVQVSINPDAHERDSLSDVTYGLAMARKALLPAGQVLNTRDQAGVDQWLKNRT